MSAHAPVSTHAGTQRSHRQHALTHTHTHADRQQQHVHTMNTQTPATRHKIKSKTTTTNKNQKRIKTKFVRAHAGSRLARGRAHTDIHTHANRQLDQNKINRTKKQTNKTTNTPPKVV